MINDETLSSFVPENLGPIIYDRVFWIYFIITLFFIIVGMLLIMTSNDPYLLYVSIIWLISNVALIILAYQTSIAWGPKNTVNGNIICFVDRNSGCFETKNRVWLFVNLIFIVILVLQVLWASELYNVNNYSRTLIGVFVLIMGLTMTELNRKKYSYSISFWIGIVFLLLWFSLTLYVTL